MALYAREMQTALTGRAGDWLSRRAWPHLTMIAAFVIAGITSVAWAQRTAHHTGLAVHFSITFLAGYAVFVLCLALWLARKPTLDRESLLDDAPEVIETKNPWSDEAIEARNKNIDIAQEQARKNIQGDPAQAMVGLALLMMVFGLVFVVSHMVWYARWYLGRLMVLGGKVRHRSLGATPPVPWLTAPVRLTVWAGVILLVHYALLGFLLQCAFPQAATIEDVMRLAQAR